MFNSTSNLPYIIRTVENHAIYGPSTNDLVLSDYVTASGIQFPSHIQTIYNTSQNLDAPIEEFVVQTVTVDPQFPLSFFDGLPANQSDSPKAAPSKLPGLDHWQITEFSSNMLWAGGYERDFLRVENPVEGMPNVYWLVLDDDSLGVRQLVIEFEDEIIVGDAPPQYSKSVIDWIDKTLKKPITHLWVSPVSSRFESAADMLGSLHIITEITLVEHPYMLRLAQSLLSLKSPFSTGHLFLM